MPIFGGAGLILAHQTIITPAQVALLHTTPVVVLPAAGAGRFNTPLAVFGIYDHPTQEGLLLGVVRIRSSVSANAIFQASQVPCMADAQSGNIWLPQVAGTGGWGSGVDLSTVNYTLSAAEASIDGEMGTITMTVLYHQIAT